MAGFEYAKRYESAAIVVVLVDRSGVRTAIAATDKVEVFDVGVVDDVASLTQELLEQPARSVPGRAATLNLEPNGPGL